MLWMAADRAHIRDGMHILEIGCGWGAMTFWLAAQFPQTQITAIAESTSRAIHLQKRLKNSNSTTLRSSPPNSTTLNLPPNSTASSALNASTWSPKPRAGIPA